MKWLTTGQIVSAITLVVMIAVPSLITLGAFAMSILLVCLETYLVAKTPSSPGAELAAQLKELKDQIGNIQLAMAMRRE